MMQNETTSYKDTVVYKSSLRDAKFHDEVNDWRESYMNIKSKTSKESTGERFNGRRGKRKPVETK